MRKLYISILMLGACVMFAACNDEWKDELYEKMISFKAPVGDNGLNEIYIRYQPGYTGYRSLSAVRRKIAGISK